MTEAVMVKQEVDPETVPELKAWLTEVSERTDEVVETLQDEGVKTESVFLEESTHGPYLVTYMEAEDWRKAQETFEESTHEIDVEHKQVLRECLADSHSVDNFEPLFHAANPHR